MKTKEVKFEPTRILAIYLSNKGFGYTIMDGITEVIDFGMARVNPICDEKVIPRIKEISKIYDPITLILEDCNSKYSRKNKHAKTLIESIILFAKENGIPYKQYNREMIREVFRPWKAKSKFEIAEVIVRNIECLKNVQHEKTAYPWKEPYMSPVFGAVSLGMTHFFPDDK